MAIEHVTPLYHWNQLSAVAGELNRKAGQALAFVMNGSEPYEADVAALRELLQRGLAHLDAATGHHPAVTSEAA